MDESTLRLMSEQKIKTLDDDAAQDYFFEVDLSVSEEDDNRFNAYPLAPENLLIEEVMLSPFQSKFPQHQKKASTKLTPNLYPKKRYMVHYHNLKFYLEQGMRLEAIHRFLCFKQSPCNIWKVAGELTK